MFFRIFFSSIQNLNSYFSKLHITLFKITSILTVYIYFHYFSMPSCSHPQKYVYSISVPICSVHVNYAHKYAGVYVHVVISSEPIADATMLTITISGVTTTQGRINGLTMFANNHAVYIPN